MVVISIPYGFGRRFYAVYTMKRLTRDGGGTVRRLMTHIRDA